MIAGLNVPSNLGVGTWIERRARIAPDAVALIGSERSFTYRELAARIRRLANGLRQLGVARGDRVAWIGPNHPAALEALFAAASIGAALAPVNHRLGGGELAAVLEDADPTVLIRRGPVDPTAIPGSVKHQLDVDGEINGAIVLEALVAESPDDPIDIEIGMEELCLLAHTSGTIGPSKGIVLTHANVTWNVVNFLTCADFRSTDVTVAIAPFFRVGGTGVNVLPLLFVGGTVVVSDLVNPDDVLRSIQTHRVSIGFGNPDSLDALVRAAAWPEADLSSVRFMLTGGAPVPERLIRAFLARGVTLLQGYGLSEAAPLVLLLDPESALTKIGAAGRPPLFVDVRIVDADGRSVPTGRTGELLVRGPNVMAGYWRRPDDTRDALSADGWLRTGDAARSDDDGDIWIVDRIADRFLSDGRTVYPGDVERVLLRHPSIADVGVVDVPSDVGSVAIAVVVPAPGSRATEEEILAFGRGNLAPHQVPASVAFVDELPRSQVGKLLRGQLRALVPPLSAG